MSTQGEVIDQLNGQALVLEEGRNIALNVDPYTGLGILDSLDTDLLRVAAFIYAADLATQRHERELHLRSIAVTIPVVNLHAFERVHGLIEQALTTLSVDNWSLKFTALKDGQPANNRSWPKKSCSTLMFSGGLDSFAGSLYLLKTEPELTLVSHVTHNRPIENSQSKLFAAVTKHTKQTLKHLQVRVFGRNHGGLSFPADSEREDSQRTRSFLFTSLAAVAARLSGARRILVMAENGQFAIHLPLSEARVGSFSTHTAHPKFLTEIESILRQLFNCADLEVINPFVNMTKGEVVRVIPKPLHGQIANSLSCWRASRVSGRHTHCGECVPCLCRRIANEINGVFINEYQRDLLSEDIGALLPDDLGKRNLLDLCQFIANFEGPAKISSDTELSYIFPELLDTHLNASQTIAMYRRFSIEAFKVFRKYPHVAKLLQ